mgnify:CR=1 FL=1
MSHDDSPAICIRCAGPLGNNPAIDGALVICGECAPYTHSGHEGIFIAEETCSYCRQLLTGIRKETK